MQVQPSARTRGNRKSSPQPQAPDTAELAMEATPSRGIGQQEKLQRCSDFESSFGLLRLLSRRFLDGVVAKICGPCIAHAEIGGGSFGQLQNSTFGQIHCSPLSSSLDQLRFRTIFASRDQQTSFPEKPLGLSQERNQCQPQDVTLQFSCPTGIRTGERTQSHQIEYRFPANAATCHDTARRPTDGSVV